MFEYASVSAPAYDTASLITKINEQAAGGWEVITIVATGGDVTAFLKRASDGGASGAAAAAATEPAGWGTEPVAAVEPEPEPIQDVIPEDSVVASDTAFIEATSEPAPATAAVTVEAGWYKDPSTRYEQRYWDGQKWTEHVHTGGVQSTDPPVA